MSNKQFRITVRIMHLIIAGCMAIFIYSPLRLDTTFASIMQLLVIPIAVITGFALWQQPAVLKFFKRGRSA